MLEQKKDYDYKKKLEIRSDNLNFDASLVPFLPDDLANLDDILDMVTGNYCTLTFQIKMQSMKQREKN